ncbi:FHA domain-containing protein [Mycolicibacterium llatzerense]|uniref:FHA domain-containing protein n=1 Tax=Mycolicibacterium llatzerense TaxID=280871 RepID=UPI0021B56818|nr:FHA domain-containing protein [Mycolicibacterium llatzerense]MCT7371955.1 hypothetical protein [Mycolicibacterium llatzerense]
MAASETDNQDSGTAVLTVIAGSTMFTFTPRQSPVIIGRGDPAADEQPQVRLGREGISRHHLIVEYRDGRWIARDNKSLNGTFANRERVTTFDLTGERIELYLGHPTRGELVTLTTYDPANVYVGALVAKARQDKGFSQRGLNADKVVSAGALIAFEKGRAWPREDTQRNIENEFGWSPGEIARLRAQYDPSRTVINFGDGELTDLIATRQTATAVPVETRESTTSEAVDTGYLADWVQTALQSAIERIDRLPPPTAPDFLPQATPVLDELNRLEALALNASTSSPQLRATFIKVHQQRRALMLAAAQSPAATLGHQLFAARDHAGLSLQAAATLAGVTPETITAAEDGKPLPEPETRALQQLLTTLG